MRSSETQNNGNEHENNRLCTIMGCAQQVNDGILSVTDTEVVPREEIIHPSPGPHIRNGSGPAYLILNIFQ